MRVEDMSSDPEGNAQVAISGTEAGIWALAAVVQEHARAEEKFSPFNSAHEGFAVILEEMDELWTEVRKKDRNHNAMMGEATQVAAMALRFLVDIPLLALKDQEIQKMIKKVNELAVQPPNEEDKSVRAYIKKKLDSDDMLGAIQVAAGYFSTCWSGRDGNGAFDSVSAENMANFLFNGIRQMFDRELARMAREFGASVGKVLGKANVHDETERAREAAAGVDAHSQHSGLHDPKGGSRR